MSLHRYLPPEEVAALSGHDRAKYAAERPVFAAPGSQAAVLADVGCLVTAIPGPDATREEVDRFREDARATADHRRRPRPAPKMAGCVVCKRLIKVRSVNGAGPRCAKHKAGAS